MTPRPSPADARYRLIHGDCLDVMRTMDAASVDAVVTDPPYGIGGEVTRKGGASVDSLPDWDRFDASWISEAALLMRDGASLVAFTDCKRPGDLIRAGESAGLRLRSTFYWVKANPPPNLRRSFQSAVEVGVWMTKGPNPEWAGGGATPNVYWCGVEPGSEDRHPTQKPVSVMSWLIRLVAAGGVVIDPFTGSGTTGVAAIEEGCSFIGIEREAEYVAIAEARLKHASRAPLLPFDDRATKAIAAQLAFDMGTTRDEAEAIVRAKLAAGEKSVDV